MGAPTHFSCFKSFTLALGGSICLTCIEAVGMRLRQKRNWTVRSAGDSSKGERTYVWAWIATTSAVRYLLVRKHRRTGEVAFHYCFVPDGQLVTLPPPCGRRRPAPATEKRLSSSARPCWTRPKSA